MRYFKGNLKDGEIPGLVFFLSELLKFELKIDYSRLEDKDIQHLLDQGDTPNQNKKALTIQPVKDMFELMFNDTRYRPKYTSIEYLLHIYLEEKISFKEYVKNNKDAITLYFQSLNYQIQKVNPDRLPLILNSGIQTLTLGANTKTIQVNLDEGIVKSILESIAIRFGDSLFNELSENSEFQSQLYSERIAQRLSLTHKRHQNNSERIIRKALEFGSSFEGSDNIIDPDWISEFFNISQDCSNEMLQYIWAKILANEVDKPGSFSRRTLNAIKLLNQEEAQNFSKLCSCLWVINSRDSKTNKVFFKNSDSQGNYSESSWGFDSEMIQEIEDLGLAYSTFVILEAREDIKISFFDKRHILSIKNGMIEIEVVKLTAVGNEISSIVNSDYNMAYYEHTISFMKKKQILVT